ncbi:MAG: D-alanine--D-alanine ligase [Candidatus Sumerlaeia bacterium]
MPRERIVLVFGGQSPEHDVSLASARAVLLHLNPARYDVLPVYVTRQGGWVFPTRWLGEDNYHSMAQDLMNQLSARRNECGPPAGEPPPPVHPPSADVLQRLRAMNPSVVWILIHGPGGEDGVLQAALEGAGLPYMGSGPEAGALCMDKRRAMDALAAAGLPVPPGCVFLRDGAAWRNFKHPERPLTLDEAAGEMRFLPPWVVKPNRGGSSVGVSLVTNAGDLNEALERAAAFDPFVLVQVCVSGTEVTCGVLEQWSEPAQRLETIALPPTQIIPRHSTFFDYQSKYTAGETMEITPANLDPRTIERIQDAALRAHHTLGCRGFSRTDMIVQDGIPFILETNTIPGMTSTSLLPQGAAAIGLDFPALLEVMLQTALIRAGRRMTAADSAPALDFEPVPAFQAAWLEPAWEAQAIL